MQLAAELALARCEYDRTLEHLDRILRHLQATLYADSGQEHRLASEEVRCQRAELLVSLGRWDQALEDVDRLLAPPPTPHSQDDQSCHGKIRTRALICAAQIAAFYGDFKHAIDCLSIPEPCDRLLASNIQLELGAIYARTGQLQSAYQCFEKIHHWICDPSGREELRVTASAHLQCGLSLFRERQLPLAKECYLKALELSGRLSVPTKVQADAHRYLGILYNAEGNNQDALREHQKALRVYFDLKLQIGQAKTYSSIGQSWLDLARLEEALFFTHKAERISRRLGAEAEVAAIYGKLGNLYVQMGEYSIAVSFHLKDIDLCRRFGNYRAIAYAMHNIGLTYRVKGEVNEALDYLHQSLQHFVELGDPYQSTKLHLELARTFIDRSRLGEAQSHLQAGEQLVSQHPNNPHRGHLLVLQGLVARLGQNLEQSQQYLRQAIASLGSVLHSPQLAQAYFELGLLCNEVNDKSEALSNFREALRVSRAVELRHVLVDCIRQIEHLDERQLMDFLVEDLPLLEHQPGRAYHDQSLSWHDPRFTAKRWDITHGPR